MSDANQGQFKQTLLIALVLLLVLFVGIQTWYLLELQKQLDVIYSQQSSTQFLLQEQDITAKEKDTTESNKTAQSPDSQQSALPEKEVETPAANPDKNVRPYTRPYTRPPLAYDDPYTTPYRAYPGDPYKDMQRRQREMDRRFNQRFNDRYNDRFKRDYKRPDFEYHFSRRLSVPEIDVRENDNQYTVLVNLPGTDEKDISVTLDGQRLTVKGKQNYKKEKKNATGNIVIRERQSGRFRRGITLSHPVKQNEMKSRLENGVLVVIIPKVPYRQWR